MPEVLTQARRWSARRPMLLVLTIGLLAIAVMVVLFPVFWMVSSSLKPRGELFARDLTILPVHWTLDNYRNVWQGTDFPIYFLNSFEVATVSTIFTVVISMYAAYAIARIEFRGRGICSASCCW